jgi:hypothetical protein
MIADSSAPVSEVSSCYKTCYLSKHVVCFLIGKLHPTVYNNDGKIKKTRYRPGVAQTVPGS